MAMIIQYDDHFCHWKIIVLFVKWRMGELRTPALHVSLLVIYPFPNILYSVQLFQMSLKEKIWVALGNQTTTHCQPLLGDV